MLKLNRLQAQLKPYRNLLNCPLRGYGVNTDLLAFEWNRLHGLPFSHKQLISALEYGILSGYKLLKGKCSDISFKSCTKSDSPLKNRDDYLRRKRA